MKQKLTIIIAITSVFIITCSVSLNAQVKKGDWLVEGNIGNIGIWNNSNEYFEAQGYSLGFYPRVGYFIGDNLVIGSTLNFSYSAYNLKRFDNYGAKQRDESTNTISLELIPYLRYYFNNTNLKNKLYGQLGGGMGIEFSGGNSKSKGQQASGEALIGINHFFTNTIALNSSIGYYYSNKVDYKASSLSWKFGFIFIFPKKQ